MSLSVSEAGSEVEDLDKLGEDVLSVITYESESEKKSKKKKKTSHKPPRSPKSPYLSNTYLHPKKSTVWRSLRGTGAMHTENPAAKVPRELWLASLNQSNSLTQSLKSEHNTGQPRTRGSSGTPEYLKEALGMKKARVSRSATNGYVPGTPDYKEKEDMYDEIIELKKMLQSQKSDNDLMKTKLRRLEEENSKKNKQIEQLLDPSKSSEFTRCLVDKKNDASVIVKGLKQKILKLEQQCKEKDSAINKLQTDLKTTSLEEMKIAMETYYEEIQRLQILLANAETEKKSLVEGRDTQKRQKVINLTILRLSKSIKQLQEENKSLKIDLDRALGSTPASSTARDYSEWSKQKLVRRIMELEKKVEELESASLRFQNNGGTSQLALPAPSTEHPEQSDTQQECERLRGLVKKLKGDRSELQTQLGKKDAEVKQLLQEKAEAEQEIQRLRIAAAEKKKASVQELEETQRLKDKIKRLEAELEDERCNRELEDERRNREATAESSSWREDASLDEAATVIQSAFRGHSARQKQLLGTGSALLPKSTSNHNLQSKSPRGLSSNSAGSKASSDEEMDEAVTLIQSTFRGHLTRTGKHSVSFSSVSLSSGGRPNSAVSEKRQPSSAVRKSSLAALQSYDGESETGDEVVEELESEEESDQEEKKSKQKKKSSYRPSRESPSPRWSKATSSSPARDTDSDDSDDIVVSPSRPLQRRDSYF